jgi:PKHD-type hydroxylase
MLLKDYYWIWEEGIPQPTCEKIIKLGLSRNDNLASVGFIDNKNTDELTEEEKNNLLKLRNSNVSWIGLEEKWLFSLVQQYVYEANINAGWNFEWDYSENMQFTKYNPGQYYGWHCDQNLRPYEEEEKKGKIRKLSSIISLSDPNDYDGGDLQFDYGLDSISTCNKLKRRGSIIVFPSFVYHQVTPVTEGIRYSLVSWHLGMPFK